VVTCLCGGVLKIPKKTDTYTWEKLVARFMVACGVPGFSFDGAKRRFIGVKGFSFVRVTPKTEGGWATVPWAFNRYETIRTLGNPHPTIMFLTSRTHGDNIEDSYVLMRLETFAPMLKQYVESDPQRYLGKE